MPPLLCFPSTLGSSAVFSPSSHSPVQLASLSYQELWKLGQPSTLQAMPTRMSVGLGHDVCLEQPCAIAHVAQESND